MRLARLFLLAIAIAAVPFAAHADDVGGSGFSVPQNEWLWGVEGLVRTPVDLSVDLGVSFRGYEMDGRVVFDDRDGSGIINRSKGQVDLEPTGIEGGFRLAGGIGYWNCCVLIEPAMAFRGNRPLGDDRTDDTPTIFDPDDVDEGFFAEAEIRHGWELVFGPQISWMVPEDTAFIGPLFGGKPLVFFPVIGVTHIEWDAEIHYMDGPIDGSSFANSTFDRNFEDDVLTVGFDVDFPLPGSHSNFNHALTFGFRWIEGNDDHDMGPFAHDDITAGNLPSGSTSGCGIGSPNDDQSCVNFDGLEGWRIGLYYRITWNDFEGFVKRNIFGPAN